MTIPVYPILLFDTDGVPYGCLSEKIAAGYVEGVPEEFVSAFDARGVPVQIVVRGDEVEFNLMDGVPREGEAIDLLRSYARSAGIDPVQLLGGGLLSAIDRIIEQDRDRGFPRRFFGALRAYRHLKFRTGAPRSGDG